MDVETGEIISAHRDKETGETPARPQLNSETGEPETTYKRTVPRRSFRIPKEYIRAPDAPQSFVPGEEFLRQTRVSSVLLFLLPTIFFAPIVAIALAIIELALHAWAHKKNRRLRGNADSFYQSPLHVIISEFCASCVDERMKHKITKMQDRTNNKLTKYGDCFRIVT